jgi:hypothetical protein
MLDIAEDTTQLQNAVRSLLSAVEPEESVAFASLVYFYNGRHYVRYNGRILCVRVDAALDSLDGASACHNAATYAGQHQHRINAYTHALSGI